MENNEYYAFFLDDPAAAAFISAGKMYIGQVSDLEKVAENMEAQNEYIETAAALRQYFAGDKTVEHNIAMQTIPVLTPVKIIEKTEMRISERQWSHTNTWDSDYVVRFSEAVTEQILVSYNGDYIRCIRPSIKDFRTLGPLEKWMPLNSVILGNKSVIDVSVDNDGHDVFKLLLYVAEEYADDAEELKKRMRDPEALEFKYVCDEVFGDG